MTAPWFYEYRFMGRWCPALAAQQPTLRDNMRVNQPDGPGHLLRTHPVQIRETDIGRGLDELQQIYGEHPND